METTFKKKIIVLLSGLVVFCGILLMPLPEGMTESNQRMLAVAVLMAIWWVGEGTSIAVTALLPLILFPLLGIMSSKQVAPNYANHLIFLFLGGFMIALSMEKWLFHNRLALWIINLVGTDPKDIVLGFMINLFKLSHPPNTILKVLFLGVWIIKEELYVNNKTQLYVNK